MYCYSLLKPNTEWLRRFSFYDYFELTGEEMLETKTLSSLPEVDQTDVDVLKIDVQGLELQILLCADKVLNNAFMVETESGFVANYIGESTYSQIDEFMRSKNFLLFDINTSHRVARNNVFKDIKTRAEQLMWAEAVWLKDYVALANNNKLKKEDFQREKVLKILVLCALQGCIDYGFEIATLAREMNILSQAELKFLEAESSWHLGGQSSDASSATSPYSKLVNYTIRLFPMKIRKIIKQQAEKAVHQKHLLRF
jgi:hypothetical protein